MKKKSLKLKRKKIDVPFFLGFIMGLMLLMYPFISERFNEIMYMGVNREFDKEAVHITKEEKKNRYELAKYYNDSLVEPEFKDPYIMKKQSEGRAEYAKMLEVNEMIGYIDIPMFGQKIPIYAGTSENVLQKGVGHMEFTSLPIGGKGSHTVLTAHSGMSKMKMFSNLRKMKKNDIFLVHNLKDILAYKVVRIYEIEPDDYSSLNRYPGKDYCTLLTCSPYLVNTRRLLVRGERVNYDGIKEQHKKCRIKHILKIIIIISGVIALIVFVKKKLEID